MCQPQSYEDAKTVMEAPININDKKLYGHPTIKPLEFIKKVIRTSSVEGAIVADFFLGSGTTAVACKELNRKYLGFEINLDYFKIAQNRINGINKHGQTSIFTDFDTI